MKLARGCGILLHPTCLPGKYGQGELGKEAYKFIDFLKRSEQSLWQILPLNPVGSGYSPYQPFSAFAGNPMLISIDKLLDEGLLTATDLNSFPVFPKNKVRFNEVKKFKNILLQKAFNRFKRFSQTLVYQDFKEENQIWLDNYALFMALKSHFGELAWNCWETGISLRKHCVLASYEQLLAEEIEYQKFLQFKFFTQWLELKHYANQQGIKIIGDLPIFISMDSSDVWGNPHFFVLDEQYNPLEVAGVPPDYFSSTGQIWGNPVYRWDEMVKDEYKWWRERFKQLFKLVDLVRIDHFRGFEACWQIPVGEKTAAGGRWVEGPGDIFFTVMESYLGELPVIAEDLGVITAAVKKMKNKFGYPGMKVVQFILEAMVLPSELEKNSVIYTGTHDNDPLWGWYKNRVMPNSKLKIWLDEQLGINERCSRTQICWTLIELVYQTTSNTAIIPLQDLLCLGSEARMNQPGTALGNWDWRFEEEQLNSEVESRIKYLAKRYKR